MPQGRAEAPHPVSLEVLPASRVMGLQTEQQSLATAIFSDGSRRDVTSGAAYTSNAGHLAEVDRGGRIRTGDAAGEAAITVNYMGHVAAVRILLPRPDRPGTYPLLMAHNHIDELVWAKLHVLGIVPSEPCDDGAFLLRPFLDVLGTLPRP